MLSGPSLVEGEIFWRRCQALFSPSQNRLADQVDLKTTPCQPLAPCSWSQSALLALAPQKVAERATMRTSALRKLGLHCSSQVTLLVEVYSVTSPRLPAIAIGTGRIAIKGGAT